MSYYNGQRIEDEFPEKPDASAYDKALTPIADRMNDQGIKPGDLYNHTVISEEERKEVETQAQVYAHNSPTEPLTIFNRERIAFGKGAEWYASRSATQLKEAKERIAALEYELSIFKSM